MSDRVTRSASRAASRPSAAPAPAPVPFALSRPPNRGNRTPATPRRNRNAAAASQPAIPNQISTAYGSSGTIATPPRVEADQALRSGSSRFSSALAQAQSSRTGQLPAVPEDSVEADEAGSQADPIADAQARNEADAQLAGELNAQFVPDQNERSEAPSGWAPRGNIAYIDDSVYPPDANVHGVPFIWRLYHHCKVKLSYWLELIVFNPVVSSLVLLVLILTIFIAAEQFKGPLLPWTPQFSVNTCKQTINNRFEVLDERINVNNRRLKEVEGSCIKGYEQATLPRLINWFELGQGARIDTRYTSPSYGISRNSWIHQMKVKFSLRHHAHIPMAGGAIAALQPWEDGGLDRWCAPPSRGKMQIVVNTVRDIAPTELVIEHISRQRAINIGDAPKEVELWVQISDPDMRARYQKQVNYVNLDLRRESNPQVNRTLDPAITLPPEFVCIGRWWFDVEKEDEIQSFSPSVSMSNNDVKTNKIAVRVNSNWGSLNATCVNRFRLHGVDMSGEREYLELKNDGIEP